ncbi:MAG: hypothetical protein EOO61_16820, partial [Hymenobacter sp.]
TVSVIHLSQVAPSVAVNGQVNDWKDGKKGSSISANNKENVYQVLLQFALVNDLAKDTTFYYRVATNSTIKLLLYNDLGHLLSSQETGYNSPVHQRFGRDDEYILPITIRQGQRLTAQVIIKGFFGSAADTESYLYTYPAYLQYLQQVAAINNTHDYIVVFFVGAVLMLLLFFLFMYVESKQKLYGRYALYLSLQWLYGILKLGSATLVGFGILHHPFVQFALVEPVVIIAVGCYAWFVNELLDLKVQNRWLYGILKWFAYLLWAYSVAILVLSFVLPDMHFRQATWSGMRLFLLVSNVPILLYIGFKVKSSVKTFYLIGNFLFLLFSIVAGIHNVLPGFTGSYLGRLTTTAWYMMGIMLECIFFAFALGIRIKELQRNKQTSDEKLIEQMQENERLSIETNQQLELKVSERTDQIRQQAQQLEEVRLQETRAGYEKQLSETRMQA